MTRIALLLIAAIGLSGCTAGANRDEMRPEAVDQSAINLLAKTYTFGVAEAPLDGCRITLEATPVASASDHRPVEISSACREKFSSLFTVKQWAPMGGASIALFGGEPLHEIADFSPVQDGTGVYLRGGMQGDSRVYELRTPGE